MSDINNMNLTSTMTTNRQVKQDTSKFTPDDWIRYIAPLVTYALRATTQGIDAKRAYQKFILLGVLVGLGKTPQEAINQVQEWQNTGASQLLKSGTSTGSAATSGNIGTGVTSTDGSGGIGIEGRTVLPPYLTSFKFVNGGMGIGRRYRDKAWMVLCLPIVKIKQDASKFTPDDWIRYVDPPSYLCFKRNYARNEYKTFISEIYFIRCTCRIGKKTCKKLLIKFKNGKILVHLNY